jgi:hypothetical protein
MRGEERAPLRRGSIQITNAEEEPDNQHRPVDDQI